MSHEKMAEEPNFNSQNIRVLDLPESKIESADFETAINYARYGKFHRILLGVCGTIYATCAISTTTLSFVLPSAQCDFRMSSADKGKLSAMPLIGMIFGCTIWGYIANSHGRKSALLLALMVDFIAGIISSFAQNFEVFLLCRFFSGFGIIGATSIIFPYFGEFLSRKIRDQMLGRLEIFWNIGIILLPGLAWLLLSRDMQRAAIISSPWRKFVLICSLPSLLSLVLLYFLPETPKFFMLKHKHEKAKLVFRRIFALNSGQPEGCYPVLSLEGECLNNNNISIEKTRRKPSFSDQVNQKLNLMVDQIKSLCLQPYLKYLCITVFADFGLMASYYTLIMWFPEIFERFANYEAKHPDASVGVCAVSQATSPKSRAEELFRIKCCNPSINNRVFLDTIITGISCIPTSVTLSFFMNKFGKKYVLIAGLLCSGLCALSLNFVVGTTQTLLLSCIFEALTSILEAVVFCLIVDLFPTNLRATALTITATFGRIGAICGNIALGMLIDINCIIPIYLFGFLLIGSGILCFAIPKTEDYIVLH